MEILRSRMRPGPTACAFLYIHVAVLLWAFVTAANEGNEGREKFSEYDIKAAYITNFVRYVEWPKAAFEDESSPFLIGVLGENPFGETLARLASEQRYGERVIEVKYADDIETLAKCHLVFFCNSRKGDIEKDLASFSDRPVLTVGERKGFADKGGEINFTIVETRVKFEINLKSAKKKRLKINSQLLKVAVEVIK